VFGDCFAFSCPSNNTPHHTQPKHTTTKIQNSYIRDVTLRLSGKADDLEDVMALMGALSEVRAREGAVDEVIAPIEEMYALLARYEVRVPKEEAALVSDLRYGWRKLRRLATDVSDRLAQLQAGFRRDLVREVRACVADAQAFRREWDAAGPMAPGLPPMEAMDRLRKFQQMFEVRKRKWDKCAAGEQLFGLAATAMPELEQTEKEIAMLDRLYGLYVTVLSAIKGYGDTPWTEVVERVGEMGEAVVGFQAQCRKLPKALRDWPAYTACRDTIDNFLEQLPLFDVRSFACLLACFWGGGFLVGCAFLFCTPGTSLCAHFSCTNIKPPPSQQQQQPTKALAHPAMRERHWRAVMAATGHQLNLAEDAFRLQHLLECGLLAHREEVEEIAGAAVKEEAVETKLAAIESDWAAFNLVRVCVCVWWWCFCDW
jgi:dynein heavy chain